MNSLLPKPSGLVRLIFLLGILIGLGSGSYRTLLAQDEDEIWSEPVNLSRIGTAREPVLVPGSNREFHVFWKDSHFGFMYTIGDGEDWRRAQPVRLPFSEPPFATPYETGFMGLYSPELLVDEAGTIHGFWRDSANIGWYSQSAVTELAVSTSWTVPLPLFDSLIALDVAADASGRLHIGYIRPRGTEAFPAGVYYQQTVDSGASWSDPRLIYQSDYFGSVSPQEANIQIGIDDDGSIHLAWDDTKLDMVFVSRSPGSGETWSTPTKVDGREPEDDLVAAGPAAIHMLTSEDEIHLTWRAEHGDTGCSQYHQWSTDGGRAWQPKQIVVTGETGCPSDAQFIVGANDLVFLLSNVDGEFYMQAWRDGRWSAPELQQSLTSFIDPVTYRQVDLSCHQTAVIGNNELLVVGCGSSTGDDVWQLTRPLGSAETWLPPEVEPVWSRPTTLLNTQADLLSPVLVDDRSGLLHAFWLEATSGGLSNTDSNIYYTRWDGERWSRAVPILNLGPVQADHLYAVIDDSDRFFVMWNDLDAAEYFFSQVDLAQVLIPAEWSSPREFPSPHELIRQPQISVGQEGILIIVYTVPYNEERGVYLIHSEDDGSNWSQPTQIFDGGVARWPTVGASQLVQTEDGVFHVIWAQDALQPEPMSQALYYARSEDGGESWSEPMAVVQGAITWNQFAHAREQNLVLTWLEESTGVLQFWSIQSSNGGAAWERPFPVPSVSNPIGRPNLISDSGGQLHLMQATDDGRADQNVVLRELVWRGSGWQLSDNLDLAEEIVGVESVVSQVYLLPDIVHLVVAFAAEVEQAASDQTLSVLFATDRLLTLPTEPLVSTAEVVDIGTVTPTSTALPSLEPSPTPTINLRDIPSGDVNSNILFGLIDVSSSTMKIAVAIVPAAFIVALTAAFYLLFIRRTR